MFETAYTPSSLRKHVRKSDFERYKALRNKDVLHRMLQKTAFRANGMQPLEFILSQSKKRGKPVYTATALSDQLLLRKASAEIKRVTNRPTFSRETLVASLRSLLREAPPYRLFRFDIASFYESFNFRQVLDNLKAEIPTSPTTRRIVDQLLKLCDSLGCTGLPRGIGISQSLADLMLLPLDSHFMYRQDVFFYGRYVDDIIILAEPQMRGRHAIDLILQKLPNDLQLNQASKKKKVIYIPRAEKENRLRPQDRFATFSYLGYQFNISNIGVNKIGQQGKNRFRTVSLDIANEKVKKIKTKLVRAILDFLHNSDFLLLEKRLKLLTSNYSLPEKEKRRKRLSGIHYNYSFVQGSQSAALPELDSFLRAAILSKKGDIFYQFNASLSATQKRKLLSYSFKKGFIDKRVLHFSPKQVRVIGRCWQDI